ncbi:hypothetical protein AIOGIFDO_01091 [Candidatus Methanoperedenaceae archaeon GB37]|nr:hypothetical protein AIOGIFDO_01091 [Candidatus Methanoperedenaceae archaeon GB37]
MLVERIRKLMGWCPMAVEEEKREFASNSSFGYEFKHRGLRTLFASVHLVIGIGLLVNVFFVIRNMPWFPGWILEIDITASMLLSVIALFSIFIAFDIIKSDEAKKVLSLTSLIIILLLFVYLAGWTASSTSFSLSSLLQSLQFNYTFTMQTLILFTLIIAVPNLLNLLRKGSYRVERRTGIVLILILILVPAVFASLNYHINMQKSKLLIEKGEEYGIYHPAHYWWYQPAVVFVDSDKWSTGTAVSQEEYDALKFLKGLEDGKVMAWWDFGLRIKALAKKEAVIYYGSEEIKRTIARPGNKNYEPAEKVRDVAAFFTTGNEDEAKAIMEKYEAVYVYLPKNMYLFNAMKLASGLDTEYENSMYYRFENNADIKHFEKLYENEYGVIYKLREL